ncbi:glycosyltransferase family 2 protein [Flexibacterium corallicola]|uniref:glycosyltransferase family 2 protein n=1 Tax=Flexibacterium corallicola TaxID=3037259 RepID=UPI00286FAC09|nr:glycosyltransferase family 2 protein [Pseudovibrio sp. M1P-2-3]
MTDKSDRGHSHKAPVVFSQSLGLDKIPETFGLAVVCAVRNEALRLADFLRHYRAIGAEHFFIIDNGSTDGSLAQLISAKDVSVFCSSASFKKTKGRWFKQIADKYLKHKWVLFVDADELFVYPGFPDFKLGELIKYWEANGVQSVYAPLVDMYSKEPPQCMSYNSEESLLATYPYFDGMGYRIHERKKCRPDQHPHFYMRGGVRERFFYNSNKILSKVEVQIQHSIFKLESRKLRRFLMWPLRLLFKRKWPCSPILSKVPLHYWRKSMSTGGGSLHSCNGETVMADDWCSLLHFKFLPDFEQVVARAIERGEYWKGASEYKVYQKKLGDLKKHGLMHPWSRQLTSMQDLKEEGLMRTSAGLEAYLDTNSASGLASEPDKMAIV